MQFSELGPDIPEVLIEGSLGGDIVFVCGAGVSKRAGLPLFMELVENIYIRLGEARTEGEEVAFQSGRYEETLGALSRRLADPRRMLRAVEQELAAPNDADLSAHDTIIRLSRDLEGKPVVVTTNFDTLFERRLSQTAGREPAASLSHAGAQVPAPGGLRFNGLIHLHGRLADVDLGVEATDLVLTSADFGDAYLRSGWAARFLFDLCRCRTIVLVGYTANDPPVRYILNIIEADRARFPELHDVYAFTGDDGTGSAVAAWETVAVEPVPYSAPAGNHSRLWTDLRIWSDLAADSRQWRAARLGELLAREPHDLLPWERDQAKWLLKHPHVAGAVAGETISGAWITFIGEHELITSDGALRWSVGQWAARRLANVSAFKTIVRLVDKLAPETGDEILRGLRAVIPGQVPTFLVTAWRLLVESLRRPSRMDFWKKHYAERRVEDGTALTPDLSELIKPLVPSMRFRSAWPHMARQEPTELSHICEVDFEPENDASAQNVLRHVREGSPLVFRPRHRCARHLSARLPDG
jgi:SIR2-like domain